MSRRRPTAAVAVLAASLWIPVGVGSQGGPEPSRLSPSLRHGTKASRADRADRVDVIVTFERGARAAAERGVRPLGQVRRSFENLPFVQLRVPARALEKVAATPGVKFVSRDGDIAASSEANRVTANTPPLKSPYDNRYNGQGLSIAVIDSGVGAHHDVVVDLRVDFVEESASGWDPYGHGTHVAGIAVGEGGFSQYTHWGQAWRSRIVSLRVLDGEGRGTVSNALAALDWILSHGADHGVAVVNLSIGKAIEEAAALDPLVQAVEAVWDAGFVVVCSAGNYGEYGFGTITSPGNSRKVITVGSLTDSGTGADFSDDYVSTYSSRGPTKYDNFLKPDLLAPGNRVVAPMSVEGKLMADLPERIRSCLKRTKEEIRDQTNVKKGCQADYFELSGTSMAAAMVSGVAARMLDKEPGLSPGTIKARLMKSARKIPGPEVEVGAGVLDVYAALDASGYVKSAPSPRLVRSKEGRVLLVEDPELLWGGEEWSAAYLWSNAYLWSDAYLWSNGYLWSDAYLWSNAFADFDAYLWSNGLAEPAAINVWVPQE